MPINNSPISDSAFKGNRKLLYIGVAAVILMIVAAALAALFQLRQQVEIRTSVTTQNMARSIEKTIEGMIDIVDVTLLTSADEIGRQIATGNVDAQAATRFMDRQLKRLPQMDYLRASNARGDVIYGPGILSPPNNIADRDYFILLRDNPNANFLVSRHLIGRIAGKWAWLFVRRINNPDGSFGGVVFAGILSDRIEEYFSQFHLDSGGSIVLRDANMGVIARYLPASATGIPYGDKRISLPFVDALKANRLEGTYVSGETSIDGISRTHSYRRNEKYGFTINVGVADKTALAEWHKQAWFVAGLVVAYILASLVFLWLINLAWRRQEQDLMALQASRQALREAQEIANLGRYAYDLHTARWTSSDILDGIFGIGDDYPRDAAHWLELVAPESRTELQAYLNDVIERHLSFDREYRIVRPCDGKERWVHGKGKLQLDALGNPLALVGAVQDITERKQVEAKLVESESHLRTVIENEPESIKIVDAQGRLIQMNPAGLAMMEADSLEQVAGRPMIGFIAPEYRAAYAELHKRVLAGESLQMEYEVLGLKGRRRWLDTHAVPMSENGKVVHLAVTRDITDRKEAEQKLRLLANVFTHAREGIMITTTDGKIIDVNDAFTRITGYGRDEVLGRNPRLLSSGRQGKEFYATLWRHLLEDGYWHGEVWNRRKNGEVYAEMLTISGIRVDQGDTRQYVALFSDITERKQMEEQVRQLAFYDVLTNLPNRRLLNDRLGQAMAASKRSGCYAALIFLDLDNFKSLNDTHGHEVGDLLLIEAADRLKSCVREMDTVARFGGDEFVVMLSELDVDKLGSTAQAGIIAEKIRISLAIPYMLKIQHEGKVAATVEHHCTASIGVALFFDHEASQEDVLKWADAAMYQAKEAGRNSIRFYDAKA